MFCSKMYQEQASQNNESASESNSQNSSIKSNQHDTALSSCAGARTDTVAISNSAACDQEQTAAILKLEGNKLCLC